MSSSYLTQSQSGLLFLSQQHLTLQCRSTVCWRNRPGQKQPWLHGPSEPGNSDGADVCNTDKQNLVTQEFWKCSVGSHEFQGQKWNPKQMSPSPEWGCSCWIPGVGGIQHKARAHSVLCRATLHWEPNTSCPHRIPTGSQRFQLKLSREEAPNPPSPSTPDKRAVMAPWTSHSHGLKAPSSSWLHRIWSKQSNWNIYW